jgi:hypothetical protein
MLKTLHVEIITPGLAKVGSGYDKLKLSSLFVGQDIMGELEPIKTCW